MKTEPVTAGADATVFAICKKVWEILLLMSLLSDNIRYEKMCYDWKKKK